MPPRWSIALAAILLTGLSGTAQATPECRVRILRPVTDDLGNRWRTGKILPTTLERETRGRTYFCAEHGSCIPATINRKPAARLLDCTRGRAVSPGDYLLVPVRHRRS
ncbi:MULTISPECIES: hypothetical protein [unclassified Sphingomonas]|uniref:hypothetical protein n=1 Tax=unclassified Sphingomonas TaxID=196159 RepID=UPI0006FE3778|nr:MULTISPECIES: hypothetical protein [unclassified Sphingomonas]KQM23838.1 hypothetical protein ASE58_16160 [Sphingomonas sp. Leaf9]KQM41965.1 hypothetical protein ASE57_16160 [Sphingomonas sp. Leaf11]